MPACATGPENVATTAANWPAAVAEMNRLYWVRSLYSASRETPYSRLAFSIGSFFSEEPVDSFTAQQRSDAAMGQAFFLECFDGGLLLNGNARCYVPMILTDADTDEAVQIMDEALGALARKI